MAPPTPGVGDGQEGLARCSPRGRRGSDTLSERLNTAALLSHSNSAVRRSLGRQLCSPQDREAEGQSQRHDGGGREGRGAASLALEVGREHQPQSVCLSMD